MSECVQKIQVTFRGVITYVLFICTKKRYFCVTNTAIERRKEELEALPLKRAIDDSMFQGTQGKQNLVPVLLGGSCPKDGETVGCNL